MNKVKKTLKKATSGITLLSEYLYLAGGIIILGVAILVATATISRYFFGSAIAWATEIGAYSLLVITFLGGPLLVLKDNHINVDIIPNFLGDKGENVLYIISNIISGLISGLIGYYSIIETYEAFVNNIMIVSFINTPKYILFCIMSIGFILMTYNFIKVSWDRYKIVKNDK